MMIRDGVFAVATATMALLCGCATSMPSAGMNPTAPAVADKATFYVIDDLAGARIAGGEILVVNGQEIGALNRRQYTWFQITPGEVKISVNDPAATTHKLASRLIQAEGGKTYYIRYLVHQSNMPPIVELVNSLSNPGKHDDSYHSEDLGLIREEVGKILISGDDLVGNLLATH